ncbi:hypothetical protein, partial [Alistipes sp. ZOR0009]|uniref:hypothetical protein n=1 Tax=Alistipes sp. ZOR0009 TaxID=1339253 RepID=UPI0018CE2FCE
MLGALSGCEKEKSATEPVYNPISRLDAEVLLKQWNAERKGRLKSATTLNLTEEQWGRAKVYQNLDEAISTISIPLSKWKVLCFGKNREGAGVYFCEVRPDDHYLELNGGRINKSTYTGYLVFFNDKGKGIAAYCYVDGRFKGVYEVATQQSFFKDITKEVFNLEEVVVVANRESPWKWIHDGNKGWTLNLCMPDYTFEERGGGYSNGTSNPDPKPEVDTSDANFRNTKAACILAKLLGKTNTTMYDPSTVVGKLLKDYWGKTAAGAHNLKFVVSPSSMLVSGSTHAQCETDKSGKSNNVIIRISQEYMESCSNIELVRTLIHESIHAEIYVRMQGLNGGVSTDADFARLFEQYKTYGDQRDH